MKKSLLLLLAVIICSSCQSAYEKQLAKMTKLMKERIEDAAFKSNTTIEWLEYKDVKYDTITPTVYRQYVHDLAGAEAIRYAAEMESTLKKWNYAVFKAAQGKSIGVEQEFIEPYLNEAQELQVKFNKLHQELKDVNKADSIMMEKLRTDKDLRYRYTASYKMTAKYKDGNTENFANSIEIYFENDLTTLQ